MRQLAAIDFAHVAVVGISVRARVSDIGKAVGKFDKRSVWRLAYALIIMFARPFRTRATFVIGQRVDYLGCHKRLITVHIATGYGCDVVIREACILDAVMEIGAEEQRQDIVSGGTDEVTIPADGIDNHIEMVAVGMVVAIGLIDTGMKGMGGITDAVEDVGMAIHQLLEFTLLHR